MKPSGTKHLKLKCDSVLSTFAFKFNLCCCTKGTAELANKLESALVEQQGLLEATADDRERLAGQLAEAGRRAAAAEEAGEQAGRRAAAAEEAGEEAGRRAAAAEEEVGPASYLLATSSNAL